VNAQIFGDEVSIENAPFYTLFDYHDYLLKNSFVYLRNALDVSNIQLTKIIQQFEDDKRMFYFKNISKAKDTFKFQKQYFFDTDVDLYFSIKNSPLFESFKFLKDPVLSNHLWVRKTQNTHGTYPHCDRFFFIQNSYFYTIWVALEDLEVNNGVLCLVKPDESNTNLQTYIDKVKSSFNSVNPSSSWQDAKIDITPAEMSTTWVANNMNKGDAVIFRSDVLHGSTNTTTGKRFSLDFRITDGSTNFDKQWFNT